MPWKPNYEAATRMNTFYYVAGAVFTLAAFMPGISAPLVALVVGLYYMLNTPIGETLNPHPVWWYGFFFVVDSAMAFYFTAYRDPVLLGTAACFGAGALLTLGAWLGFALPNRLYSVIAMMLNAGILASVGVYLVR